jgi:hypothetical protein
MRQTSPEPRKLKGTNKPRNMAFANSERTGGACGLHEKPAFGTMHVCVVGNGFMRDASKELRTANKIDEIKLAGRSWT